MKCLQQLFSVKKAKRYSYKKMNLFLGASLLSAASSIAQIDLQITEIYSGQQGTKLTADWIEIKIVFYHGSKNLGGWLWFPQVSDGLGAV